MLFRVMSEEEWDAVMAVHLEGSFHNLSARHGCNEEAADGGSIAGITSGAFTASAAQF